jgi:hypothetical protein
VSTEPGAAQNQHNGDSLLWRAPLDSIDFGKSFNEGRTRELTRNAGGSRACFRSSIPRARSRSLSFFPLSVNLQRRHQARAPPWSSSTGSRGLHAPDNVVAFTGMRNLGAPCGSLRRSRFDPQMLTRGQRKWRQSTASALLGVRLVTQRTCFELLLTGFAPLPTLIGFL